MASQKQLKGAEARPEEHDSQKTLHVMDLVLGNIIIKPPGYTALGVISLAQLLER